MNCKFTVFSMLLFLAFNIFAQSPQSFNYQAIARTADGEIISNQQISFRVSILEETIDGASIYSEEHSVTSNQYGLVTFKIGNGESPNGIFSATNWGENLHFIKIEIKVSDATEYIVLGTSQLLSVPYALHAETTSNVNDADADPGNEIQDISLSGTSLSITDGNTVDLSTIQDGVNDADADPLNELQTLSFSDDSLAISNGNKVFLPGSLSFWSSDGNNIFYNTGKIGVGSNTPQSKLEIKGNINDDPHEVLFGIINRTGDTVFAVYQGGVRINVDDDATKATGNRGGFAVGGFSSSKGTITNELLRVTKDSTRIYVNNDPTKGNRGGFAVGGFSSSKSEASNFLDLTQDNYFIGHESGKSNTDGLFNSFIGYKAGHFNTVGNRNTFLGYYSGFSNTVGNRNIFIGDSSGYYNIDGFYNVFIGNNAGTSNINGFSNVFVGNKSGSSNIDGKWNVFVGHKTGHFNTTGTGNVFVGSTTGYNNTTGINNVFVGDWCGNFNTIGSDNVFLGNQAGWNNIDGNTNIFIGSFSGYNSKTGSDNIFFGDNAGYNSDTCYSNIFIGNKSGYSNSYGIKNIFLGFESGYSNQNGNSNIFIGNNAGYLNNSGYKNTFIGDSAGYSSTTGRYNVFIGDKVGYSNSDGMSNVMIGATTGKNNTTGRGNTFLGNWSGYYNSTGSYNVYLGNRSGWNNDEGTGNVFIGSNSGFWEYGSNKLYIENTDKNNTEALIYGEFDTDFLRLNARVGIGVRPEYDANLFILDTLGPATIKIRGGSGDDHNYSRILLESKEELNKFWQLAHSKTNDFGLVFNNGELFFSRFQVFADGGAMVRYGDLIVDSTLIANKVKSNGGIAAKLNWINGDYAVTENDYTLLVSTSSTAITISLPVASTVANQIFIIKKTDSNNDVIITPDGTEQIDFSANFTITSQNSAITIQSDGTNWYIIGKVN